MTFKPIILVCSLAACSNCFADTNTNTNIKITPFYDQLSVTVFNNDGIMENVIVETDSSNGIKSVTNSYGRTTIPIQLRDSRYVNVNVWNNEQIIASQRVWVPDYERSMFGSSSH